MKTLECKHQSQPSGKDTGRRLCSIGHFNGRPFIGQCNACMDAGGHKLGLGDLIERIAKPFARALRLDCIDSDGKLKATSPCAKRRDKLNKIRI